MKPTFRHATAHPLFRPGRRPRAPGVAAALTALIALAAGPEPARAGAWTQPSGRYYGRVAFAGIDSRSRFDESGDRIPLRTPGPVPRETEYQGRELRGYVEHGLLDRLTVYGSTTYKSLVMEEPTARRLTSGFGDLYLGGRYRLTRGGIPVSVSGDVKLPLAYSTGDNPALGAGQVDATVRGLAGASWGGLYATADGGFVLRAGDYQEQILASLEMGGRFVDMLGGRGVLRWQRSIGSSAASTAGPVGGFDPALQSPRLLTLDGVVNLEIMPGLELEAAICHALSGRSTLAGNTFELALVGFGPVRQRR